jgi:hypothetical protein
VVGLSRASRGEVRNGEDGRNFPSSCLSPFAVSFPFPGPISLSMSVNSKLGANRQGSVQQRTEVEKERLIRKGIFTWKNARMNALYNIYFGFVFCLLKHSISQWDQYNAAIAFPICILLPRERNVNFHVEFACTRNTCNGACHARESTTSCGLI